MFHWCVAYKQQNSNTIVPFPLQKVEEIFNCDNRMKEDHFSPKLYRMLEDAKRVGGERVISWLNDGLFFVVY